MESWIVVLFLQLLVFLRTSWSCDLLETSTFQRTKVHSKNVQIMLFQCSLNILKARFIGCAIKRAFCKHYGIVTTSKSMLDEHTTSSEIEERTGVTSFRTKSGQNELRVVFILGVRNSLPKQTLSGSKTHSNYHWSGGCGFGFEAPPSFLRGNLRFSLEVRHRRVKT